MLSQTGPLVPHFWQRQGVHCLIFRCHVTLWWLWTDKQNLPASLRPPFPRTQWLHEHAGREDACRGWDSYQTDPGAHLCGHKWKVKKKLSVRQRPPLAEVFSLACQNTYCTLSLGKFTLETHLGGMAHLLLCKLPL